MGWVELWAGLAAQKHVQLPLKYSASKSCVIVLLSQRFLIQISALPNHDVTEMDVNKNSLTNIWKYLGTRVRRQT